MKEKLIINNFAGIRELEIELNRINILIGPQASGKSITAKLFFYFKSFIGEIRKGIENGLSKKEIDTNYLNKFVAYFPKEAWPYSGFSIHYLMGDTWMKIQKKNSNPIRFEYSDNIKVFLRKARLIYKSQQKKSDSQISHMEFILNYYDKFNSLFQNSNFWVLVYSQHFIPAGRSFFSNIQSNIFSILHSNKSIDPFLVEFGSFYEALKGVATENLQMSKAKKLDSEFEKIMHEILNSDYIREREKDFLIHLDKRKVNLENASSGQQEILPLVVMLKILTRFSFLKTGATLYIEEPEAHLFPNSQKKIIQLLARVFNSKKSKFQIFITTHSPYILSSFNNLIYAGLLAQKLNSKQLGELYKIVPKEEIIDPQVISAYSLELNGRKRNLIDKETNLIAQNVLDDVSNEISSEFGKLMDLEY